MANEQEDPHRNCLSRMVSLGSSDEGQRLTPDLNPVHTVRILRVLELTTTGANKTSHEYLTQRSTRSPSLQLRRWMNYTIYISYSSTISKLDEVNYAAEKCGRVRYGMGHYTSKRNYATG